MKINTSKLGMMVFTIVTLLTLSQISQATVINSSVVGNDAINRSQSDTWSNFVLGLKTETFTTAGTVSDWSVYTNNTGTLGMLILRNTGADNYQVIGADFETVSTAGINNFTFNPDTGSANVMAGDILGLFIGSAKVDFDYNANSDVVNWCGNNGCISDYSQLDAGQTLSLTGGPQGRSYSANVSLVASVTEPASLALFGLGLAGLGFCRKQQAKG